MMLGGTPLASAPFGAMPSEIRILQNQDRIAELAVSSLIIPAKDVEAGILVRSTACVWNEIVSVLGSDWSQIMQLSAEQCEELVAGAFKKAGYDDVVLTPRSGDFGRDVIATKHGVGCVKIIDSVKRYAPGNVVPYDDVRALMGVMSAENDVSKGIITTTSDFPPNIDKDPLISSQLPTRLELMNGAQLQGWLTSLRNNSD